MEKAGRGRPAGEEHGEVEVALALMQGLLRAGCMGTALGCVWSPALVQQLCLAGVGALGPKSSAPSAWVLGRLGMVCCTTPQLLTTSTPRWR